MRIAKEKGMNSKNCRLFTAACALVLCALWAKPASAQMSEVKEKPPMYSYVANWAIPRAHWADMDNDYMQDAKILDKAMADGTIVGYGYDVALVHTPDGGTHDDWWSSMSLAGLFNTLNQFYATGTATSPVLMTATKHWDNVLVSRYYNWHSGTVKNGYGVLGIYKLKPHAPSDALDNLSKNLVAPLLEKMLADGTVSEYEIDTEAIDTDAPGTFWIYYLATNADALDKVDTAIRETLKANPMAGPAFGSATESSAHRDGVSRSTATYK
jgi:hypothetical protein